MTSNTALRALVFHWALPGVLCAFGCIVVGVSIAISSIADGLLTGAEVILLTSIATAGALAFGVAVARSTRRNARRLRRRSAGRDGRRSPQGEGTVQLQRHDDGHGPR